MKKILFYIVILFLVSCGNNPLLSPPVVHPNSFEELINFLETPAHTAAWLNDFAVYSDPYTGWEKPHNKDLAFELAYALWENYIQGKSRGKCASFASLFVVAAREHGYSCGIVNVFSKAYGHAIAWIEEEGKISTTDNLNYFRKRFNNLEEMKTYFKNKDYIMIYFFNNKYELQESWYYK